MEVEENSPVYKAAFACMRDAVYSYGVAHGRAELRTELRSEDMGFSPFGLRMRRAGMCDALIEAMQERTI